MSLSGATVTLPLNGQRVDAQHAMAQLRFGMFVHFGPSAVVGAEIGWGRRAARYKQPGGEEGPARDEAYDTAYRAFLPEPDWATRLVDLAVAGGMRYLTFTTKHHDGYPNFRATNVARSIYPDYYDTPLGRSGRDLTREIADACHAAGLKFGMYYSPRDWTQPDLLRGDHDSYFTYLMEHLTQLLTDYGKVDFLFYDAFGAHDLKAYKPPLLNAYPRQLQPGIIINDRGYWNHGHWAGPEGIGHPDSGYGTPVTLRGDYSTPEQHVGEFNVTRAWESCITLTPGRWSWQSGASVNPLETVIGQLVGTATGDGNLLLNVGPMPTGYVEPEQDARLREVGAWMQRYGEAIYGTRGGPFLPNEVGGSTFSGRTLNLFFTAELPRRVRLPGLNNPVLSACAFDRGLELGVENLPNGDTLLDLGGLSRVEPATLIQLTVTDPLSTEYTTTPMVVEPN